MDQHPVPQNISSYEFHLVGDMTLKQFFQVAGGLALAALFFRLPLPGLVKWPLMLVSGGVGAMMAFVPVNGRPFSQWLTAFFKSVYSPTIYNWSGSPSEASAKEGPTISSPSIKPPTSALDSLESQLLTRFSSLFDQATQLLPKQQQQPVKTPPTPSVPLSTEPLVLSTNKAFNPTSIESISRPLIPEAIPAAVAPQTAPTNLVSAPTYPNIIAGVVVDSAGKTLEGAIIEIVDNRTEIPVRAFRTNRLGQFQTATPLSPGPYTISAEKDGFQITPISLQVAGTLIPPILIRAT